MRDEPWKVEVHSSGAVVGTARALEGYRKTQGNFILNLWRLDEEFKRLGDPEATIMIAHLINRLERGYRERPRDY